MQYFFIKSKQHESFEKVMIKDIVYIKSDGDYIEIHLNETRHVLYHTLTGMVEKLCEKTFYRCHDSYLVNIHRIINIEQGVIKFDSTLKTCRISSNRSNNRYGGSKLHELLKRLNYIQLDKRKLFK